MPDVDIDQIRVGKTVRLLNDFRPGRLALLRQRYADPDSHAVLTPDGDVLGSAGLQPALEATREMLDDLDGVCLDAVLDVRRKLGAANLLEMIGKLLAGSSCGALIVVILHASNLSAATDKALALAILGLLATALPLLVHLIREGIGGDAGRLVTQFARLRDLSVEARALKVALSSASNDKERTRIIAKANDVAKRAGIVLIDLGYDPRASART